MAMRYGFRRAQERWRRLRKRCLEVSRCPAFRLAPFDEIQNALQVEKPGALGLTGFADGDRTEASIAGSLVKFRPAKSAVKLRSALGWANPDGQSVASVL